jgi:hypothetical protein
VRVQCYLPPHTFAVRSTTQGFDITEIGVNARVWSSVSEEDKARITEIIRTTKLISEDDSFAPDALLTRKTPEVQLLGIWCELACKSAYVAAVAACQALIETPPYALCLLAAEAGKEVWLGECD